MKIVGRKKMAKQEIYTCDRCKKEVDVKGKPGEPTTKEQFWTVGLVAKEEGISMYRSSLPRFQADPRMTLNMCRPCLEEIGYFLFCDKRKNEETEKPVTIQDLIEEIVEESVEAHLEP
jgi:hypothetical protein